MKTRTSISFAIAIALAYALYPAAIPFRLTAQEPTAPGCGRVEGRVTDQDGLPLEQVRVYSLVNDRPGRGRVHDTQTGSDGRFILDCVEPGPNGIYVSKEEEGYPDTYWTPFISRDLIPFVNVVGQETIRGVEIRLGPKSGRLSLRVLDASSLGPVENAKLIMCRADDPNKCSWRGFPSNDEISMLLPPVTLAIKIQAPGYEDWFYRKDSSTAQKSPAHDVVIEGGFSTPLSIRPMETKSLVVSLRPTKK
jgi:hypothetical protein